MLMPTPISRRLRKGAGADIMASGATRISGSRNFKAKHAQDYPLVETVHIGLGKVATRVELEALGVVAPEEKVTQAQIRACARQPPRLAQLPALHGGRRLSAKAAAATGAWRITLGASSHSIGGGAPSKPPPA